MHNAIFIMRSESNCHRYTRLGMYYACIFARFVSRYPTQDRIVVRMTIDRMEWIMTLFSNFWKSLNYPYGILWMTVRKIEMENFFSCNCDLRNGVLSIIRSSFFLSTLLTSRDRTIETLWIFAFFEAIFNNFFMIN